MNHRTERPAVLRDSWRPDEDDSPVIRRASKLGKLGLLSIVILAAGLAFFFLLAQPILHPNTYVVLATGDSTENGSIPPIHFAHEDLAGFESLSEFLAKDSLPWLDQSIDLLPNQELNLLQERIQEYQTGSKDVLIVYLSAHGLVINGKACLLVDGFDRSSPGVGSVTVRSVIELMNESTAQTKLLILDTGQIPYDAWMGNLANQFTARLRESIGRLEQPNTWVLVSNDLGQTSCISEKHGTSVFAYYVRKALEGAGDLDGDGLLELQEFSQYVMHQVEHYSDTQPDAPSQRPILLATAESDSNPVLMSVDTGSVLDELEDPAADSPTDDNPKVVQTEGTDPTAQKTGVEKQAEKAGSNSAKTDSKNAGPLATNKTQAVDESQSTDKGQSGDAATDPSSESLASNPNNSESGVDSPSDAFDLPLPQKASLNWTGDLSSKSQKELANTWSNTYGSHADLVASTWDSFFALEKAHPYPRRPMDYAPVQWRRLGEQIAHYDFMIRRNRSREQAADRIREISHALEAIKNGEPLPSSGKIDVAAKIINLSATPKIRLNSCLSIGHLREMDRQGFCDIPADTMSLLDQFDQAVRAGNSRDLKALLIKSPGIRSWYEPWIANRLIQMENLTWSEVQQAMLVLMMAGRSTNPIATSYSDIHAKFSRAHDRRRVGIQMLLEQTVANWRELSKSLLLQARREYQSANHDLQTIQNGLALRNEILFRLPYYLKFPYPDAQSYEGELYLRLDQLMDATLQLSRRLQERDQPGIAAATAATTDLLIERNRFLLELIVADKQNAKSSANDQKSLINRQSILLTPGVDQRARNRVLASLRFDFDLEKDAADLSATFAKNIFNDGKIPNELLMYQRQSKLVLKLAELASIGVEDTGAFQKLQLTSETCFSQDLRNPPTPGTRSSIDQLNQQSSGFMRGIPSRLDHELIQLQDVASFDDREQKIRRLEDLMALKSLIDARDEQVAEPVAEHSRILLEARCFSMIQQQRNELFSDFESETSTQIQPFEKRLEFQRMAANELNGQPVMEREKPKEFEINCTRTLSLTTQKAKYLDVQIDFKGNKAEPVWVFAEFDPGKIRVLPDTQGQVFDRNNYLVSMPTLLDPRKLRLGVEQAIAADETTFPPTTVVRPGESNPLRMRVVSVSDASHANLYLTVVSASGLARHETAIVMPDQSDWELVLDSPFSVTSRNGSELTVSPLPNQSIDYDFRLRNLSGRPRKISLELFAAPSKIDSAPPSGELDARQLLAYFDSVGSPTSLLGLGELDINSSSELQTIPLQTKPEDPMAPKGPMAPAKKEDSQQDLLMVRHGVFVVATDLTTLKSKLWLVRFRPQMPRKYVTAQARYDSLQERIIIDISRSPDSEIPTEGHRVICEFADPLVSGTESYLEGQITAEKRNLRLFAHVPKSTNRVEKLFLHIDNYPRAFIFNVPCGNSSQVVSESRDEMRIQIKSPDAGSSYQAPVSSIPVRFEVDAPVGAFADSRDLVQLGLDADRDRELAEESTMTWTSDRQATVWISEIGNSRKLKLVNQVSDFNVELPGANYQNLRVNLLAKLQIGRKTVWSNPREIGLDAAPPKIVKIKTTPAEVASQEDKLSVQIVADDIQMSGVKEIKVGFFDSKTEKLDEKLPQVDAEKQADNSWIATLPLADLPLGFQKAAAIATDEVGNQSDLKTFGITVISKEAKEKMAQTFVVKGSVRYYKTRQPNVPVQLTAADGKVYSGTSSEDGTFQISEVPAGDYFLKAKSVIRNRPRIAELRIKLTAEKPIGALDIELK